MTNPILVLISEIAMAINDSTPPNASAQPDPLTTDASSAPPVEGQGAEAASDQTAPAEPTIESALRERDEAREEAQRYLGIAQRAQADLQNFRRRAEQERAETYDRGRGELLLQLL